MILNIIAMLVVEHCARYLSYSSIPFEVEPPSKQTINNGNKTYVQFSVIPLHTTQLPGCFIHLTTSVQNSLLIVENGIVLFFNTTVFIFTCPQCPIVLINTSCRWTWSSKRERSHGFNVIIKLEMSNFLEVDNVFAYGQLCLGCCREYGQFPTEWWWKNNAVYPETL